MYTQCLYQLSYWNISNEDIHYFEHAQWKLLKKYLVLILKSLKIDNCVIFCFHKNFSDYSLHTSSLFVCSLIISREILNRRSKYYQVLSFGMFSFLCQNMVLTIEHGDWVMVHEEFYSDLR